MFILLKNMVERINSGISNMSIFKKLIITFIIIIFIPLSLSYYISQNTVNDLIVKQISTETMSSIEQVANSIDSLMKKMGSMALYVNEDGTIKNLIIEEADDAPVSTDGDRADNLKKLKRINSFNSIISNMALNMMGTKCYITILTSGGHKYTNWACDGNSSDMYLKKFLLGKSEYLGTGLMWTGLQKNYVDSDRISNPYVLTLVKNIFDTSGENQYGTLLLSIPEDEISRLLSPDNKQQKRLVLDDNQNVISSTEKDLLGKKFTSLYNCLLPAFRKGYFIYKYDTGEKSIVSYNTTKNWKIIDIKSYNLMTQQFNEIRNKQILANAASMIFFLIVSAFLARNITKPIRRLSRIMLKSDIENTSSEKMVTRTDEIGNLEASFYIMRGNIRSLMQENREKERKKRDAELQALQAQISPHFLFNTLNAIRWAAINKNNKKAAAMVLALSNLLRMTVVKGDIFITIDEELDNLANYVAIFQMRHSIEFRLVINVDENIKKYKIPKLLLQPLVENSIIHGFEGGISCGVIEIAATASEDEILLKVMDNGVGMGMDNLPVEKDLKEYKFSGIGVTNVDERIKLYYGEQYGLRITSFPEKGTTVEVRLPKQDILEE